MTTSPATPAPGPSTPPTASSPGSAAPAAGRVAAQARFDATVMLRNGEQLLLTLVLPALLLVGLAVTHVPDLGPGRRIDVVAPGVLALAVMSTAFTGQAIGTGFDRRYGVLRLLATTPLGRGGLLAGRILAVLVVEAVQGVVLGGLALGLGWRPSPVGALLAVPIAVLGTAALAALGLLLAGTLRAEAVLAAANLAWVLLLVGGGVVLPADRLGGWGPVARLLPSGALGDALRTATLHGEVSWAAVLVLAGWAAAAAALVTRFFRWD